MLFAPSTIGNWRTDLESQGLYSNSQETLLVDFWLGLADLLRLFVLRAKPKEHSLHGIGKIQSASHAVCGSGQRPKDPGP